jgi:hypothetical protein
MILWLGSIFNLLMAFFAIVVKNPIVTKMLFFATFITLLTISINYLLSLVKTYIVNIPILQIAYAFGIIQAISLFISILISGFAVKQLIGFVKNT